jgi:hypothetical protein
LLNLSKALVPEEPVLQNGQNSLGKYLDEWGFSMVKQPPTTFRDDDFVQKPMNIYIDLLVGLMRDDDAYFGLLFEYLVV